MFRSLASRLVLLGVVQMLLLAVTAIVVFIAEGPHEPGHPDERLTGDRIHAIERTTDEPVALAAELAHLLDDRIEATLYDAGRGVVASNVDPPLAIPEHPHGPPWPGDHPPGSADRAPAPRSYGDHGPQSHRMLVPLLVHGQPGVLVARGVHGDPPGLTGPVLVLICGFAILVVGALLAARWIVRPIERLTKTARAIGSGELGARSNIERSDEIGELGRRMDEMADRIATLLVTEKELLANVAHELRTPLTRIGVALDLAGEGDADAARAALGEIAVDVSELEQIIDDILTAMRFEVAGTLPLRKAVVEPRSIAQASADKARARHPGRPIELAIADVSTIDVDPVLVRRVLDNLVENAHKYTPEIESPIVLAVEPAGDRVAFVVRDRGIGIGKHDLPKVFTAFFRGDKSRSRETGGVGLGLTLAKRIIDAHGGTITVDSELGRGTTVRVELK